MAFGRHKADDDGSAAGEPAGIDDYGDYDDEHEELDPLELAVPEPVEELEGPFDIEDFDDPAVAELARLDLGSVLVPMPDGAQVQVELTGTGVPSAVWLVTANGRFNIAAYAAPKSAGLWREVAAELADALRQDSANVTIVDGPWGREVVGTATGAVRFIGVDGYRWMVRCVVNGSHDTMEALTEEARTALADTVVRRGDTPLPVRTPLEVRLPEPMAEQLRAAAAQQASQQATEQAVQEGIQPGGGRGAPPAGGGVQPGGEDQPPPAARRSADGSAMQQLRTITGG